MADGARWQESSVEETISVKNRVADNVAMNAEKFDQRSVEGNLWTLSLKEREKLLLQWKEEIEPHTILDRTAEVHRRHQVAVRRKREVFSELDARSLAERMSCLLFAESLAIKYD